MVVYPYSVTGMVMDSPTSIARTLARRLVFLLIFIIYIVGMCKYTTNNLDSNTFLKKMFDNPIWPVVQLICTIYIIVYQIIIYNLQNKRLFFAYCFGQQCDKNCKKRVPDTYSDTHKIFIQWLTPLWVYAKIVDFI